MGLRYVRVGVLAGVLTVSVAALAPLAGAGPATAATHAGAAGTVVLAPVVSSVGPKTAKVVGGATVTITGKNLTGATSVMFGAVAVKSFTFVTSTKITAVAPAGSPGTVDVEVTTPSGTSAPVTGDHYTYYAVPAVTSLSQQTGPLAGGTPVIVTGTGFTGATKVSFGSTKASSFTFVSDTEVIAVSPAETAGTRHVTVTTPGGTSPISSAYTFQNGTPG
jgi:hypothetical protein